jgi:uncharacterized protein (DUF433 family)
MAHVMLTQPRLDLLTPFLSFTWFPWDCARSGTVRKDENDIEWANPHELFVAWERGTSIWKVVGAWQERYNRVMRSNSVIVSDPEIMNGTPCFRGTRVPFRNLIDYLERGHSLSEFLRQFPSISQESAIQSLEEAKESLLARIA